MIELLLNRDPHTPLQILCLGAHSDDIEIGCAGTILRLLRSYPAARVRWIVFSAADATRRSEALTAANLVLRGADAKEIVINDFRESFFPFDGAAIKDYFEQLKAGSAPDLVFTHYRADLHQDHKLLSDLSWNTFRSALILEYETPKWDGDLGTPNCYVRLSDDLVDEKVRILCETFGSQHTRHWFTPDTFRGLMRLRGVECNTRYAEAFYARKLALG